MQPLSNADPSDAWTARRRPARERMRGKTLVPDGGRWRTTNTLASRSAGSSCTTARRASTPPAEAPTTTTSCPFGWVAASKWSFRRAASAPHDRTDPRRSGLRGLAEALGRPGLALLCLGLAVPGRRRRDELVEQASGRDRDLVDGVLERLGVGAGGLLHPAHLADELERRVADLFVGRGRLEVVERSDVPAHAPERSYATAGTGAPAAGADAASRSRSSSRRSPSTSISSHRRSTKRW